MYPPYSYKEMNHLIYFNPSFFLKSSFLFTSFFIHELQMIITPSSGGKNLKHHQLYHTNHQGKPLEVKTPDFSDERN